MESASKRSKVSATETTCVALPLDVVEEILMRVPSMSLRRLREVCRSWRSIASDPSFVKAHAALHPPLLPTLDGAENHIDVVDLFGNVIKRINVPAAVEEGVLQDGPFYLFRTENNSRVRVVDPDTCAISALPVDDVDPPARQWAGHWPQPSYTPWRDFSTGNRKVLRIATLNGPVGPRFEQLCHLLNLDGGNPRRWRPAPIPSVCITTDTGVVGIIVQHFTCFLPDRIFPNFVEDRRPLDARTTDLLKSVVLFDLETEEWRPATIRGPSAIDAGTGKCQLKLVKLNNMLAMMHYDSNRPVVDLWFAVGLEKGFWVKRHSVPREMLVPCSKMCLYGNTKLLMELVDGRIVFSYLIMWNWPEEPHWLIKIYDPSTKICMGVPQRVVRDILGVYHT